MMEEDPYAFNLPSKHADTKKVQNNTQEKNTRLKCQLLTIADFDAWAISFFA